MVKSIRIPVSSIMEMPICLPVIKSDHWVGEVRTNENVPLAQMPTIFLSKNGACPKGLFRSFHTDTSIRYYALCDDFGPFNMLSIIQFIEKMEDEIKQCFDERCSQLVYCSKSGRRDFTNAAFLLGAFMILKLDQAPNDVHAAFGELDFAHFEGYRDATYSTPDFRLHLVDCWQGLHRGKTLGWVALPTPSNSNWGQIDRDAYAHYDDPLNADLHEVVPQKFVAFRGPRDLGGPSFLNIYETQSRDFDPKYYVDIFEDLSVSTVIRLNEAHYSRKIFVDKGIVHADLYFDDCTAPPPATVKAFFKLVDQARGAIAIHCTAGLGRTGTLIALYMILSCGFSAREAIGWLRIMRPGSVIGEQQHFLCKIDAAMSRRAASGRLPNSPIAAEAWAHRSRSDSAVGRCSSSAASDSDEPGQQDTDLGAPSQHALLANQVLAGVSQRNLARIRSESSRHSSIL